MSVANEGPRIREVGGLQFKKTFKLGRRVINKSGSSIAVDKLVALVGFDTTSGLPKVVLADANTATHRDVYVTTAAIANNAEGFVYKGALSAANLNTNSASAAGDPVYLSETAGGFAHTAPATSNAAVIPAGWVVVKSATVGQIFWSVGPAEENGENGLVDCAAATLTFDPLIHDGRVITLNRAAGVTVTLPAATGSGVRGLFRVGTTVTSNQYRINVTGNDAFFGQINVSDSDDNTDLLFRAGADADQINLNGSTQGGLKGDWIEVEDIAADVWFVRGATAGNGSPATPFATGQIT